MAKYVIGVDFGGTKIATCLMNEKGSVVKQISLPTLASKGPKSVIERIKSSIYEVAKQANINMSSISAIGIGSPGPMDAERGIIKNSPNLPGWVEVPLKDLLLDEFKLPLCVENDANAAALGENLYGSGKGVRNFVYITIGTGIGGGMVVDGELFKGANGNAVEIGHTTINFQGPKCACGNTGCWEVYASGLALARFAKEGIEGGKKTVIRDIAGGGVIRAEHVFAAAKQGDEYALELVHNEGYYLGVGLANVVDAFNPDSIAFGGGLIHEWDLLSSNMIEVMNERALKANKENVKVVKAVLGSNVGVIGAAAIAWKIAE